MWRKIFIAIFGALTLAPAVQMAVRVFPETPVTENRSLSAPPRDLWNPHKALREANAWFSDHFGLRSFLIRLKTQIDYSIFRTSDRVHLGPNGWLFYRSVLDVEKPAVEQFLTEHEDEVVAGLRELTAALKAKGIQPIVLVNMLADRFYPDEVPSSAMRISAPKIDGLVRRIGEIDSLLLIETSEILTRTAKLRPIFHKTDFHWNDPAAFPVAEEIVTRAGEFESKPNVWKHRLEIEQRRMSGGIASFMPLFFPPRENALFVKANWKFPAGFQQSVNQGLFEYVTHLPPSSDALGPLVLVGDSFSDAMLRSGLHLYFKDMYRARWGHFGSISELMKEIPADTKYFIIQTIEVQLLALRAFADQKDISLAVSALNARLAYN